MTTPVPPPPPPAPGGGQTLTVNRDNVLEVRKVILSAAEQAQMKLRALQPSLIVQAPAGDEVSKTSAAVWTANLVGNPDSHYVRLLQYVDNVVDLGRQLEEAAKQYGYTDEEIVASFNLQQGQM
ncbi:hypothetical protein SAMN02982929_02750 [Saccharopolyspora kobensis]|uniref:PE family protein n=1 Tax=Saccharopolyspora kobensis TaxID=146035 RepID=A0A1H6BPP5_9PSEU|nr:hypothetical protein [Saccharopolyspora kobensis]SEG62660.1 hypothetical protein SAMN02982929_02750 [Saccharopolyspora kobensis]SFE84263.1 hypothetical protein SAMN05216506_11513 [Saccharopolyspora kobensis]